MNLLTIPEIRNSFAEVARRVSPFHERAQPGDAPGLAAGAGRLRCRLVTGLPLLESSWRGVLEAALRDCSGVASVRYSKVYLQNSQAVDAPRSRRFYLVGLYLDAYESQRLLRSLELRLQRLLPGRSDAPVRFVAARLPDRPRRAGPPFQGLVGRLYQSGTELFRRPGWREPDPDWIERITREAAPEEFFFPEKVVESGASR